ncbi:MAG: hypothetical protein RLP44_11875 [Aggregatilineales bacterium]
MNDWRKSAKIGLTTLELLNNLTGSPHVPNTFDQISDAYSTGHQNQQTADGLGSAIQNDRNRPANISKK